MGYQLKQKMLPAKLLGELSELGMVYSMSFPHHVQNQIKINDELEIHVGRAYLLKRKNNENAEGGIKIISGAVRNIGQNVKETKKIT